MTRLSALPLTLILRDKEADAPYVGVPTSGTTETLGGTKTYYKPKRWLKRLLWEVDPHFTVEEFALIAEYDVTSARRLFGLHTAKARSLTPSERDVLALSNFLKSIDACIAVLVKLRNDLNIHIMDAQAQAILNRERELAERRAREERRRAQAHKFLSGGYRKEREAREREAREKGEGA